MISNINLLNGNNYVQPFGKVSKYKKISNNSYLNNCDANIKDKKELQITKPEFSGIFADDSFLEEVKDIKEKEREFLSSKNVVDYGDLEIAHNIKGDSPEERLLSRIFSKDVYVLGRMPYTGYSLEGDRNDGIYGKYALGDIKMTFIKNAKSGLVGYTDEIKEIAKYYKSTPENKTLLLSEYKKGLAHVKIININKKGKTVQYYVTDGDVNSIKTKALVAEVEKYFGDELESFNFFV